MSSGNQDPAAMTIRELERFRIRAVQGEKQYRRVRLFCMILYFPAILLTLISSLLPFLWLIVWPILVFGLLVYGVQVFCRVQLSEKPDREYIARSNQFSLEILNRIGSQFSVCRSSDKERILRSHLLGDESRFHSDTSEVSAFFTAEGKIEGAAVMISEITVSSYKTSLRRSFFAGVLDLIKGTIEAFFNNDSSNDAPTEDQPDRSVQKRTMLFQGILISAERPDGLPGTVLITPKYEYPLKSFSAQSAAALQNLTHCHSKSCSEFSIYTNSSEKAEHSISDSLMSLLSRQDETDHGSISASLINEELFIAADLRKPMFSADPFRPLLTIEEVERLVTLLDSFRDTLLIK